MVHHSSSSNRLLAGAPAAAAPAAAATPAAGGCRRRHHAAARALAPRSSGAPTLPASWGPGWTLQPLLAAQPSASPTRPVASAASSSTAPSAPGPAPAPAPPPGQPLASTPQLPLCRRPAAHVEPLAAVTRWRQAQEQRIAALGDTWEQRDGGPGAELLLRELDWVLDDVIEAVRYSPPASATATAAASSSTSSATASSTSSTSSSTSSTSSTSAREPGWEETSWRMLEPALRAAATRRQDTSGWQLRLREPSAVLWEWWERRLTDRVPFQYLISSAHWHTYVLAVGPGVLVPRPETEIFPRLVAEALAQRPALAAAPWADLGTGSGAIAIAAADVLRKKNQAAEVWAVDLSPTAAAYAAFNAALVLGSESSDSGSSGSSGTHASTSSNPSNSSNSSSSNPAAPRHVRVAVGSWFAPLRAAGLAGRLGGLLSNPPYIPRREMRGLQEEVGRHEPAGALDGGEGPGLDSLQELCDGAAEMLAPGGLIAFEVRTAGGEQADLVAGLLRRQQDAGGSSNSGPGGPAASAFVDVEVLEDCFGVRRFVRGYRAG
ncbi:hypothetical protein HXX76_007673 [Chlamydomonas incerta]|uniref:Uncharacterized protein n=1 Tax=Chlamydomonas incerta TaxID=51695 RepID=A0A835W2F0_CHLIN|nr:hypothetical protein HXX76_007673 [Chlamydomonas incerta]|eukprot:KAG2434788.1 hypothetical protein HXX76_007673 [Chlamydomonas incerta]